MSHFRLFWTATIALLPFLSRFLRSSLPSINFGSHILHLRDSGWAVKQKWIYKMHIDTLTFRASLHNVGLGKKARYFLIQTLIADCEILNVPSKGG